MTARALVALVTLAATAAASAETQVVILGTGTPVPDHERAGAGVAVVDDVRDLRGREVPVLITQAFPQTFRGQVVQ